MGTIQSSDAVLEVGEELGGIRDLFGAVVRSRKVDGFHVHNLQCIQDFVEVPLQHHQQRSSVFDAVVP